MSKPCIICVAITGSVPKKSDNPAVPISIEEQVESTQAAFELGASIAHCHVRCQEQPLFTDSRICDNNKRLSLCKSKSDLPMKKTGLLKIKKKESRLDSSGNSKPRRKTAIKSAKKVIFIKVAVLSGYR